MSDLQIAIFFMKLPFLQFNKQCACNQNRTEQNFIGNYKALATPRWHKSKPYKYKIQEAYKTYTCIIYTAENLNVGSLTI